MVISGVSPDGPSHRDDRVAEPSVVCGEPGHPEFKSRPTKPPSAVQRVSLPPRSNIATRNKNLRRLKNEERRLARRSSFRSRRIEIVFASEASIRVDAFFACMGFVGPMETFGQKCAPA